MIIYSSNNITNSLTIDNVNNFSAQDNDDRTRFDLSDNQNITQINFNYLDFNNEQLLDQILEISNFIKQNKNLKSITFFDCQFTPEQLESITAAIKDSNVKELFFTSNQIIFDTKLSISKEEDAILIKASMQNLENSNLDSLSLSYSNIFEYEKFKNIIIDSLKHIKVSHLDISGNYDNKNIEEIITKIVENNQNINSIDLSTLSLNHYSKKNLETNPCSLSLSKILDILSKNKSLAHVSLGGWDKDNTKDEIKEWQEKLQKLVSRNRNLTQIELSRSDRKTKNILGTNILLNKDFQKIHEKLQENSVFINELADKFYNLYEKYLVNQERIKERKNFLGQENIANVENIKTNGDFDGINLTGNNLRWRIPAIHQLKKKGCPDDKIKDILAMSERYFRENMFRTFGIAKESHFKNQDDDTAMLLNEDVWQKVVSYLEPSDIKPIAPQETTTSRQSSRTFASRVGKEVKSRFSFGKK